MVSFVVVITNEYKMVNNSSVPHSFHVPVMGVAYTIDSPIKLAQYGISSVISLVDDMLMEAMREMYSKKFKMPFVPIKQNDEDARAKRITSYLNMVDEIVKRKVEDFKAFDSKKELQRFVDMLPDSSSIKEELSKKFENGAIITREYWKRFKENFTKGLIDVNIMTKVDGENYKEGQTLPEEYNDAHAALRGFAMSNLSSSVVLSAGMNPKLYSYLGQFDDFFPNENMELKKKVTLKVSDFRSALIQGKFLAKKGIWVSEYRIESGLNCGGHAFASEGLLMGPILQEFADRRDELANDIFGIYQKALSDLGKRVPDKPFDIRVSAQGGVGTAEEQEMLTDRYRVDSVGWGSPFLLVKEATCVDNATRKRLADAREKDIYLSYISPLGVRFNSLRCSSQEVERDRLVANEMPGSTCPKRYLALNHEFEGKPLCTASAAYIKKKIEELDAQQLSDAERKQEISRIYEKSCLCIGLTTSAYIENGLQRNSKHMGVSICPGPNLAYFTKEVSLKQMVDHIYGRGNVIERTDRPHMFVKELMLYVDFLKAKVEETTSKMDAKTEKYISTFKKNLNDGIEYYRNLFPKLKDGAKMLTQIESLEQKINAI